VGSWAPVGAYAVTLLGSEVPASTVLTINTVAWPISLVASLAEQAPWRVRCTVVSVAHNLGMAMLGGTTPLVGAWLVARCGGPLAPAVYLAAAGGVSFLAALLLPRTAPYRLTYEFQAAGLAERVLTTGPLCGKLVIFRPFAGSPRGRFSHVASQPRRFPADRRYR
jgi:hypothetical protein